MVSCKICGGELLAKHQEMFDNRHGYPGHFDIYECSTCGFMQTEPQLTGNRLTEVYSKYYPQRDADIKTVRKAGETMPTWEEIKQKGLTTTCHYGIVGKGDRVLDVGSGACYSLVEISAMGGKAWGIDPDKNSQKVAKELGLRFHCGLMYDCPFPKKYFDLITASQVLEHEPKPLRFLLTAKKFLRPGGKIRLSFPNTGALFRYVWGRNWLHWHVPYHVNHFNRRSFEMLAEESGLKIVYLTTATPNLWTILQIRSWLNSPKIGERDGMWDGAPNQPQKTGSQLIPYVEKLLFFNRLIDAAGWGESFVVELESLTTINA